MKPFLNPVPIACALIAILGAVLSNIPMVAVSIIVAIASIGFLSARRVQGERSSDADTLSAQGRILVRPVNKLAEDIEALVGENQTSPTIQIIGGEALTESKRLLAQVTKSLVNGDELRASLRGRYDAEKEIGAARMKLEFASEPEKVSLNAAIEARTQELRHYEEIEVHLKRIEIGVSQAEAALAEMKARLNLSATSDKVALGSDDELRETIGRMQVLSQGYDESEQVIRGA